MDNLAVVRRFTIDVPGRADLAAADATMHPDIRGITGLKPTGPIEGIAEYKATLTGFTDAFPAKGPIEIIDQFTSADGTRVVTRFHSGKCHARDYHGIAGGRCPIRWASLGQ